MKNILKEKRKEFNQKREREKKKKNNFIIESLKSVRGIMCKIIISPLFTKTFLKRKKREKRKS